MAGTARYDISLSELDSEELIKQDEIAMAESPSLPPPDTSTGNLRGSRSAGHHLPQAQSSRISSSLRSGQGGVVEVHEDKAVDYRKCVWITIISSVIFLFFPVAFPCVIVAYCSNKKTKLRNEEKDYVSAKACGICTRVFSVASFIWATICLLGLVGLIVGVHCTQNNCANST